jgi:serine/threonine protein kinase
VLQPQTLPKPGDLIGAKYRIESSIGAGGMGVVFEAVHLDTDARVAIKWLSPELSATPAAVERFKVEARATGRIRHPNVVAIHDIAEHEGSVFLVMELLRGCSLRSRLAQGPCDIVEACRILFPVMRGVAAAHAVKVLHRDLKPENIFLAESPDGLEPIPKVLDFGIAKLSWDASSTKQQSAQTGLMGTYPYMAFEQLHARGDLDGRVDVYALGAVLYNMLTCRLPYEADNPVDLALRMLQSQPEPVTVYVPSLPPEIDAVVERALARDRDQRYATVDDFALALEPFAGPLRYRGGSRSASPVSSPGGGDSGEVRSAPPGTPPLPTPFVVSSTSKSSAPAPAPVAQPAPSRRGLYVGAAAAVVLLAAIAAWALSGSEPTADGGSPRPGHTQGGPPPLPPSPPVQVEPPAAVGSAPATVETADWDTEPSGQPAAVDAPANSLPPAGKPAEVAAPPPATVATPDGTTTRRHRDRDKDEGEEPRRRRRDPAATPAKDPATPAQGQQPTAPRTLDDTELLRPDWAK